MSAAIWDRESSAKFDSDPDPANHYSIAVLCAEVLSEADWQAESKRLTATQNKIAAQVIEGKAERVEVKRET